MLVVWTGSLLDRCTHKQQDRNNGKEWAELALFR